MGIVSEAVSDLVGHPTEEEWFEFKVNWYEPHAIGEYVSALSNAAALAGRDCGYLVWGVEDATHEIVGTGFTWRRDVKGEPLEHYLARQLSPDLAFRFDEDDVGRRARELGMRWPVPAELSDDDLEQLLDPLPGFRRHPPDFPRIADELGARCLRKGDRDAAYAAYLLHAAEVDAPP